MDAEASTREPIALRIAVLLPLVVLLFFFSQSILNTPPCARRTVREQFRSGLPALGGENNPNHTAATQSKAVRYLGGYLTDAFSQAPLTLALQLGESYFLEQG